MYRSNGSERREEWRLRHNLYRVRYIETNIFYMKIILFNVVTKLYIKYGIEPKELSKLCSPVCRPFLLVYLRGSRVFTWNWSENKQKIIRYILLFITNISKVGPLIAYRCVVFPSLTLTPRSSDRPPIPTRTSKPVVNEWLLSQVFLLIRFPSIHISFLFLREEVLPQVQPFVLPRRVVLVLLWNLVRYQCLRHPPPRKLFHTYRSLQSRWSIQFVILLSWTLEEKNSEYLSFSIGVYPRSRTLSLWKDRKLRSSVFDSTL